jgi:flagellar protein FlaH
MYSFEIDRDELGRRLGGGIAEGSITLIEGGDGSGKTILTQRMAYGLLVNKVSVTYISTELSLPEFMKQMSSLRYNILPYLLNGQFKFFAVFPATAHKLKKKKDLIQRLIHADVLFQTDVTIIDSLTMLQPDEGVSDKTAFDLITKLKKLIVKGKSIVITVDPDSTDPKILDPLREIADNYLIMKAETGAEDIKNVIFVKRWKRTEREVSKIIKFRVEPKFGIVIDISSFAI